MLHATWGIPSASDGQLIQNTCGFQTAAHPENQQLTHVLDKHKVNSKMTSLMAFQK